MNGTSSSPLVHREGLEQRIQQTLGETGVLLRVTDAQSTQQVLSHCVGQVEQAFRSRSGPDLLASSEHLRSIAEVVGGDFCSHDFTTLAAKLVFAARQRDDAAVHMLIGHARCWLDHRAMHQPTPDTEAARPLP